MVKNGNIDGFIDDDIGMSEDLARYFVKTRE